MTPAQQLRATMALLESIDQDPAEAVQHIAQQTRSQVGEVTLDEGRIASTVAALTAAAGLLLGSGSAAASQDGAALAQCAGVLAAAAGAFPVASGENAELTAMAARLATRARATGDRNWLAVMGQQADSARRMIQAGQGGQLNDVVRRCVAQARN